MSYGQEYFPPKGSKYEWKPKSLNYSPWACDIAAQMCPPAITDKFLWPLSIILRVDLRESGKYRWSVDVRPWKGEDFTLCGETATGLEALLAAEQVGERIFHEQMPEWTVRALAEGWRSPSR